MSEQPYEIDENVLPDEDNEPTDLTPEEINALPDDTPQESADD